MKKCKKCGAPLEGFLYKTIGKLMNIKPSDRDPEICNKCTEEPVTTGPLAKEEKTSAPETIEPEAEEKKEETSF